VGRRGQIWVAGDRATGEGHGQQRTRLDKSVLILTHNVISPSKFYVCIFISVFIALYTYIYIYIYIHTGCPRRNVPDFGRVFLMLKYTDITQNTYIQS